MNTSLYNGSHIELDSKELRKLPDKGCCVVCSIISVLYISFIGTMLYLIDNERLGGLDGSIS